MSKPSTMVQLINARQQIAQLAYEVERMKGFTLQQSLDMALIALHEGFGFGPERCKAFATAFKKTFLDYADLCVSDGKDDDEIAYTKGVVDRALRAACGDDMLPFDERYLDENLYFRDRNLKKEDLA